ncbi:ATP-binding protein [Solimicrobium silvestre]|uniref:histidine kinase n=1 Tax=Solimicrobium silvestre TaxID=2099400 RepID=A0A2S9GUC8_9BURK|nr:ATP-binding protein [Solimicrobium silvestre]PRC91319.1 Histidine kinase-, DNA gyrase B-, and HSP90-like ATPase [Solimicrobium silvestre]
MHFFREQFVWLKSGLFWRTFFFLTFAIFISLVTWFSSFQLNEEKPRAQQIASQLLSVITITRAALIHSAPEKRQELLFDLASDDGVRIYSLEDSDIIEPAPAGIFMPALQEIVRGKLGAGTIFSRRVNGIDGFWVSFQIDEDDYWIVLDRERFNDVSNLRWISWSALILLMSILAAMIITRLINQPLSRLSQAARAITEGHFLKPLPETGIAEIRDTNKSFNQMAQELARIETDRTLILAGISHDLRTPLARLQLEVELAHLPEQARLGMQSDIVQMDAIIGQFLDFAKPMDATCFSNLDLSHLLETVVRSVQRLPDIKIKYFIAPNMSIGGNGIEISRLINNLIENARRYGKTPGKNYAEIMLVCKPQERNKIMRIVLQFSDNGVGIPEEDTERLLRPFTRVDSARSQANGAGLGLAIVQRIVQQHRASMRLINRKGLLIEVCF